MLAQYFGFQEEPFGATPDPRWLYRSAQYRDALASLRFGYRSNRGFSALIAPPGMGKTTLLYQFLHDIRSSARIVFVFDTQSSPLGLLRYILRDLGVVPAANSDEMHAQLENVLYKEAQAGRTVVVVVDEAQNLSDESLEMLRLLTNYETPQAKLVHIVLAGQPELAQTLTKPSMEQLRQRITASCWLEPYSVEETTAYIRHRLELAGYRGQPLFRKDALRRIMLASNGIPRLINNLCFNALSLCREQGLKQVDGKLAAEAIAIQELDPAVRSKITERWLVDGVPDSEPEPGLEPLHPIQAAPPIQSDRHGVEQPSFERYGMDRPSIDRPSIDRLSIDRSSIDQLVKAETALHPAPLPSVETAAPPQVPSEAQQLPEQEPQLQSNATPPVTAEAAPPVEVSEQRVLEPRFELEPVPNARGLFEQLDESEEQGRFPKGKLVAMAAALLLVASGIGQLTLPVRYKPWSRLTGHSQTSKTVVPSVTRIQTTEANADTGNTTLVPAKPEIVTSSDDIPATLPAPAKASAVHTAVPNAVAKSKPEPGQSLSPSSPSAPHAVTPLTVPGHQSKTLVPAFTPASPTIDRSNVGSVPAKNASLAAMVVPTPMPVSSASSNRSSSLVPSTPNVKSFQIAAPPNLSIREIAVRYLGVWDSQRQREIQALNPQITDYQHLKVGQKIWLPAPEPAPVAQPATTQNHLSPAADPASNSAAPAPSNTASVRTPADSIRSTPQPPRIPVNTTAPANDSAASSAAKGNKVGAALPGVSGSASAVNVTKSAFAGIPQPVKRPMPTKADVAPVPADMLSRPTQPSDPAEQGCGGITDIPCPKLHVRNSDQ